MNKYLLSIIVALLLLSATSASAGYGFSPPDTNHSIYIAPGEKAESKKIQFLSNGEAKVNVKYDLSEELKKLIEFNIGESFYGSQDIIVTANIPENFKEGTYKGSYTLFFDFNDAYIREINIALHIDKKYKKEEPKTTPVLDSKKEKKDTVATTKKVDENFQSLLLASENYKKINKSFFIIAIILFGVFLLSIGIYSYRSKMNFKKFVIFLFLLLGTYIILSMFYVVPQFMKLGTPERTLSYITKEYYKGNVYVHINETYYSDEFIKDSLMGIDFFKTSMLNNFYRDYNSKKKIFGNDVIDVSIEFLKKENIGKDQIKLYYKILFPEYDKYKVEPEEDTAYFIKKGLFWYLDIGAEAKELESKGTYLLN